MSSFIGSQPSDCAILTILKQTLIVEFIFQYKKAKRCKARVTVACLQADIAVGRKQLTTRTKSADIMMCKVGWGFVCAYTSAPVQSCCCARSQGVLH